MITTAESSTSGYRSFSNWKYQPPGSVFSVAEDSFQSPTVVVCLDISHCPAFSKAG